MYYVCFSWDTEDLDQMVTGSFKLPPDQLVAAADKPMDLELELNILKVSP